MDVNPRKLPQQARARATVEAIVVATAQLLTRRKFETLTTAQVAERAGVSVGSLYQYFPNKEALAAAVLDHYSERFAQSFVRAIQVRPTPTLRESVDAIVRATLASQAHEPDLHRVLLKLTTRVEREERARMISARIAEAIMEELALHRQAISHDIDLADAAALIETLLETVVHRSIEDHPVKVDPERMGDQCRRLIMAYLESCS